MDEELPKEESCPASMSENHETACWGCGLRLLLSSYSPIFKCGWCGAITNHNQRMRKADSACFSRWRRIRDHFFVSVVFIFMFFVISAGVWAVLPVIFSFSFACGAFHCILTAIFAICTISSFCLASFLSAGEPPDVIWGSYPVVVKGGLENYTFCIYCKRPKSPRTHHCRSCRMCVLDMDHHCPFIGNCVGAANHHYFIGFLISIVLSCTYVVALAAYAGSHIWPPLDLGPIVSSYRFNIIVIKEVFAALASSALLLSGRGLVLIYLAMACFSVEIGIVVLLWQQLQFIYEGKTYIIHVSSNNGGSGERGCKNILRFFNCPYWVFKSVHRPNTGKIQEISNSKLL